MNPPKLNPDLLNHIIEEYHQILTVNNGLEGSNELYKWRLLTKFKNNIANNENNIVALYSSTEFKNLLPHYTIPVISELADNANKEYNKLMNSLLLGSDSLNNRVKDFCKSVKALYVKCKSVESHKDHHDERAAATFLTFYAPEKYTFFMATLYESLCLGFNIPVKKRYDKYEHYLSILTEISAAIRANKALTSLITEETIGLIQSDLLIAQDLVFQIFYKNIKNTKEYYDSEEIIVEEGQGSVRNIIRYERSRKGREECIRLKGCKCIICGFDFQKTYGPIGAGYIQVHHIVPVSEHRQKYKLNPRKDLVPVCPNCHAMLHREYEGKTLTIEELSNIIRVK